MEKRLGAIQQKRRGPGERWTSRQQFHHPWKSGPETGGVQEGRKDPEQWPVFWLGLVPGSWDTQEGKERGGWGILGVVGNVSLPVLRLL